jgi:flagellar basal-body rod modification protein FlgD
MHIHSLMANTALPLANTGRQASASGSTTVGTSASTGAGTASHPLQSTDNMFIQLLTAQLQNQSPIDPVDPTQFTSQLVQFNMLDQLSQINQTLQNAFSVSGNASAASSTAANPSVQGAH